MSLHTAKDFADVAKILGSPYLHHTVAMNVSNPDKIQKKKDVYFDRGVKAIEEIFDYCEQIGIKSIYEDQGYLFNGKDGFRELLNATNRNFGVVADFGNILFVDEPVEEFIPVVKDRIVNVHVKDYLFTNGNERKIKKGEYITRNKNYLKDCNLGDGIVDFDKAFAELKKIGYNGYYALECVPMGKDQAQNFAKNIEFLSKYI